MSTALTVRTLVAGRCAQVEAHADETVGAVRARAAAALQLRGGSRLLCLGAPVSDTLRVGDLRSPALLLLPVAAVARQNSAPAPAPAARAGGSLLRRSYVQERCCAAVRCEDAPTLQPAVAVLEELLAESRSAAASRADVAPHTLHEAVRSWGEDAAACAEVALAAALEAEPPQKRRKRAPAAGAGAGGTKATRPPAAPAPAAWWQSAALAALALPPELAALAREFSALATACAFLQTQHVSATSTTAASALQLQEDAAATRLGVMAALAPGLVRLRRLPLDADEDSGAAMPLLAVQLADPLRVADVRVAAPAAVLPQNGSALVACARSSVRLGAHCSTRRGWDAPSTPAAQALVARQAAAFHACCVHAAAAHQAAAASAAGHAAWDAHAQGTWHAQLPAPTLQEALSACAQHATAPPAPAAAAACVTDARRCSDRTALDCAGLLAHLRATLGSRGSIVHVEALPARAARTAELPPHAALPAHVRDALCRAGAARLFTHQVAALTAAAEGRHVAVATSTASGKSLCYAAPVLAAAACGQATSLLLFPTKALAQDQLRALRALLAPPFPRPPLVAVYDGDTADAERAHLRDAAQVLLSNPDMLHASILPSHACFARFLSRLAFVVVDEAHAYGGAFGSHTALVLRRLRRLAARYGASPRFIFTSATVANPVRHAAALAGLSADDIALCDDDGSPCGPKDFVLWNPPLLHGAAAGDDADDGEQAREGADNAPPAAPVVPRARGKAAIAAALRGESGAAVEADADADAEAPTSAREWVEQRRAAQASRRRAAACAASASASVSFAGERTRSSAIFEVALLLAECVQHGLCALAFCKSRKLAELVHMYARDALAATAPDAAPALACYRAGYTPEARRELERRLFAGELRGVAATNALELGVDVGALDVVITLGFPGSIASLWQQSGRAGRREQRALHVYVAFDSPLDACLFARPAWLFSRRPEAAAVDPNNARVLSAHAACAAFEAPLHERLDAEFFGDGLARALAEQRSRGRLGRAAPASGAPDGAWAFIGAEAGSGGPARGMSLRCVDEARWRVLDAASGAEVESLESSRAFFSVYEGAVLLHQGACYTCTSLEHGTRTAHVRRADVAYYTAPQDSTRVTPAAGCAAGAAYAGGAQRLGAQLAAASVATRVTGFTKRWRRSGVVFDTVPLQLPTVTWHTVAAWVRVPDDVRHALAQLPGDAAERLRGGMHAAVHALAAVLPLHVTCAPSDLATECEAAAEAHARPLRLLLYDRMSGGSGVCAAAQPRFAELLAAAASLVDGCDCGAPGGCVACVQSLTCGQHNAVLDRPAAAVVLRAALAALSAAR
jgi:DEAD/DEAH box helicase domain-containing protein